MIVLRDLYFNVIPKGELLYHSRFIGGFSVIIFEDIILLPSSFYHYSKSSCYTYHDFLGNLSLQLHLNFFSFYLEFFIFDHLIPYLSCPFTLSKFWSLFILGNLFYLSSNFLILISVISNLMLHLSTELFSVITCFNFWKFYVIPFKSSRLLILILLSLILLMQIFKKY